ncbi:MAG: hypothetical protein EBR82_84350 [Caulobacteraceae bacterium]|nr:hypothetical protein [Caulobacteraceae bacterium]
MLIQVGDTKVEVRAEAVLSGPRFGPLINIFGFIEAMMPLHIRPTLGQGAYWSQVLTRMLEQFEPTTEFIVTLDMDSFISKQDLEHLFALALTFQCDAIAPLQTKREDGRPMLTLLDTLDNPPESGVTEVPVDWFAAPVQQVDTAHFGCTVSRHRVLVEFQGFWQPPVRDAASGHRARRVRDHVARQEPCRAGLPIHDRMAKHPPAP